jgi:hypothetical protein
MDKLGSQNHNKENRLSGWRKRSQKSRITHSLNGENINKGE